MDFNFWDLRPEAFSAGAQFYFNVLVICIAVSPSQAEYIFGNKDVQEFYTIDELTSSRPIFKYFYINDDIKEDLGFEVVYNPHSIVVLSDGEVTWYDMIDFLTEDLWEINPIEEDKYD